MNNCSFIGRITKEVELRRTQSGKAVCSFTLAVDRPHVKDATDFVDFVVWNQGAEYLAKYAHKGSKVSATGALTSRKWEDKNGNKRTNWEIICDTVSIEDSKKDEQENRPFVGGGRRANDSEMADMGGFSPLDEPDFGLPF